MDLLVHDTSLDEIHLEDSELRGLDPEFREYVSIRNHQVLWNQSKFN